MCSSMHTGCNAQSRNIKPALENTTSQAPGKLYIIVNTLMEIVLVCAGFGGQVFR